MGSGAVSFLATFLASGVEAVEPLTIVLGVGVVRGWRSPLIAVGAALAVLAAIVAALGPALQAIPIAALRLVVATAGIVLRAPLERVPENVVKFAVGLMLTTFGVFWSAEGAGADWPGSDAALLGILGFVVLFSFLFVRLLRRERRTQLRTAEARA